MSERVQRAEFYGKEFRGPVVGGWDLYALSLLGSEADRYAFELVMLAVVFVLWLLFLCWRFHSCVCCRGCCYRWLAVAASLWFVIAAVLAGLPLRCSYCLVVCSLFLVPLLSSWLLLS